MQSTNIAAWVSDLSGARDWTATDTGAIPLNSAPHPHMSGKHLTCVFAQAGADTVPPAVLPGTPKVRRTVHSNPGGLAWPTPVCKDCSIRTHACALQQMPVGRADSRCKDRVRVVHSQQPCSAVPQSFPIPADELIAKAKQLEAAFGGALDDSLLAPNFRFEFPVVSLAREVRPRCRWPAGRSLADSTFHAQYVHVPRARDPLMVARPPPRVVATQMYVLACLHATSDVGVLVSVRTFEPISWRRTT